MLHRFLSCLLFSFSSRKLSCLVTTSCMSCCSLSTIPCKSNINHWSATLSTIQEDAPMESRFPLLLLVQGRRVVQELHVISVTIIRSIGPCPGRRSWKSRWRRRRRRRGKRRLWLSCKPNSCGTNRRRSCCFPLHWILCARLPCQLLTGSFFVSQSGRSAWLRRFFRIENT